MSGTPPTRPTPRRHSSQVRFSRVDKPPIGTLTSEDSSQGGSDRTYVPSRPNKMDPRSRDADGPYDVNKLSNPSAPQSPANRAPYAGSYYNSEADDTEADVARRFPGADHGIAENNHRDSYTATPPRIANRRMSIADRDVPVDPISTRPSQTFATPPTAAIATVDEDISPCSTVPNEWSWQRSPTPAGRSPTPANGRSPTPAGRPSAMKQPSPNPLTHYAGPPNISPYMGSPQPRQGSVAEYTVHPRSDSIGREMPPRSPQYGSPKPNMMAGYRRYDEKDPYSGHSPVPNQSVPGSPRPSALAAAAPPGELRLSVSEWEDYQRQQMRQSNGRHDSDETLQGGPYPDDKSKLPPQGAYISPCPNDPRYLNPGSLDQCGMRRRTTREVEDDPETYRIKGGVFSQLLRLAGRSNTLQQRQVSVGASSQGTSAELPTMTNLGLRSRANSAASTVFQGNEYEPEDPKITGKVVQARRPEWEDTAYEATSEHGHRRRRSSIQLHVADILTRQRFIMKLAKALMVFGAPSHRVESQLSATATVLEIDAQFIHLPSIVIASFGDIDTRTSETHFIKASGGLDLGKLHRVHRIYKSVVHDEFDAGEGTKQIQALLKAPSIYNLWHRICLSFLSAGLAAPIAFGGSFVDGLASGCLGVMLSFWQLHVASHSSMYSNIFE